MKTRLDVALVEQGFFTSREKAKAAIMAGEVEVDGIRQDKAGTLVTEDAVITVKEDPCPYVSRGGLKLAKAMEAFSLDMAGRICVDMGASTGGFTDCMLQNGAVKVFAIDVGYGQLDYKLRQDDRVVCLERTNIRYMDEEIVTPKASFVSIDVSFISVKHMLPKAAAVTDETGEVAVLVKPQFEAGKDQVGKGGIVRDAKVHREVIDNVAGYAVENGFIPCGLTYSPITGAKGNIEYLMYLAKQTDKPAVDSHTIDEIIDSAFSSLR